MKIKRKTRKLIKELKKIESGVFKFSDGKAIYYSLDEYLESLYNKITNLQNEIFDLKDTIQNKNDCIGAYECIIEDRDKRIDKAVEYIEENTTKDYQVPLIDSFSISYQKLIDILQGDE